MTADRHFGFVWGVLDHPQMVLGGHYHCAKFGCDLCTSYFQ